MSSTTIKCNDEAEQIFETFYARGWTDGLPIIPPTREKVDAMAATVDMDMDEVVAVLPPAMNEATIEKLAINAVMAGCLPMYFPVIVAATEAYADIRYNAAAHQTTTSPTANTLLINGPIRNEIGMNCSWGCLAPGNRANATIGRAVNLIVTNVGGRTPGEVTKTVIGTPGRYSMCFGEREEVSPWEPLHVELGYRPEESTVTIFAANGFHSLEDFESTTAQPLLDNLVGGLHQPLLICVYPLWGNPELMIIMCPAYAHILAREGYSKKDVQRYFYEHTQDMSPSLFSEHVFQNILLQDRDEWKYFLSRKKQVELGLVKEGQRQVTHKGVSMAARPEQFVIVVAGGDGGLNGNLVPPWADTFMVTKPIKKK